MGRGQTLGAWLTAIALQGTASCQPALRQASADLFGAVHGATVADTRLRAPFGVEPVRVQGPLVWLVPVAGGLVVVDSGFDESGEILRRAIAGRPVLAVLLTHGHPDHCSGLDHLDPAPVYVGEDDADVVAGHAGYTAPLLWAAHALYGRPAPPRRVLPVDDGFRVELGGERFEAIHLPGHTPGSLAWRFRDLLFTGDAVVSYDGRRLDVAYFFFSEHRGLAARSLERLAEVDFDAICDGHFGCTPRAKGKLWSALARYHGAARPW